MLHGRLNEDNFGSGGKTKQETVFAYSNSVICTLGFKSRVIFHFFHREFEGQTISYDMFN